MACASTSCLVFRSMVLRTRRLVNENPLAQPSCLHLNRKIQVFEEKVYANSLRDAVMKLYPTELDKCCGRRGGSNERNPDHRQSRHDTTHFKLALGPPSSCAALKDGRLGSEPSFGGVCHFMRARPVERPPLTDIEDMEEVVQS